MSPPVSGIFCVSPRLNDELACRWGVKTVLPSGRTMGLIER